MRLILLFENEKKPSILLQKRSRCKSHNKSKFDLSFATHLYEMPSLKDALIHRLPKETGLSHRDLRSLVNAGKELDFSLVKVGKREHCDREIVYTLWGKFDRNIEDLIWDKKEVQSLWKITIEDFWKLLDGYEIEIKGFDGDKPITQTVELSDFAPRADKFYEKILIMSERYHNGESIAI